MKSEPQGRSRLIVCQSQGSEHMGRLGAGRCTGRARRDGHFIGQRRQERFAGDGVNPDVQVLRQPLLHRAVGVHSVETLQTPPEPVAQRLKAPGLNRPRLTADFSSFAKADDAWHVERAGTISTLVPSAIQGE